MRPRSINLKQPVRAGKGPFKCGGGFDIDPCTTTPDRWRARVKAKILMTEADNGLSARWMS